MHWSNRRTVLHVKQVQRQQKEPVAPTNYVLNSCFHQAFVTWESEPPPPLTHTHYRAEEFQEFGEAQPIWNVLRRPSGRNINRDEAHWSVLWNQTEPLQVCSAGGDTTVKWACNVHCDETEKWDWLIQTRASDLPALMRPHPPPTVREST